MPPERSGLRLKPPKIDGAFAICRKFKPGLLHWSGRTCRRSDAAQAFAPFCRSPRQLRSGNRSSPRDFATICAIREIASAIWGRASNRDVGRTLWKPSFPAILPDGDRRANPAFWRIHAFRPSSATHAPRLSPKIWFDSTRFADKANWWRRCAFFAHMDDTRTTLGASKRVCHVTVPDRRSFTSPSSAQLGNAPRSSTSCDRENPTSTNGARSIASPNVCW